MTESKKRGNSFVQPGRYGADWWKNHIEDGAKYEWLRFERNEKARKRSRRERGMVVDFLRSLPENQTILDVPSGMGRFCEIIKEQGHQPIAVDSNLGRIQDTRNRLVPPIPSAHANIMNLPFLDNSVDAAICFRLTHHLNPALVRNVLEELNRISKYALVTFYSKHTWKNYRKRLIGKYHKGFYCAFKWIRKVSEESGWKILPIQPSYSFFENLHAIWLTK
ncbi:MAG: class I SAM-dependent methyltransferase [Desulfobacterales bacterium]|nr:class I SAM-dependent methyltransferase [Desulfobacterales bacterium]